MKCPKCEYKRTKQDDELCSETDCPKCGVIYSRVNLKKTNTETAQKILLEEKKKKRNVDEKQNERIRQKSIRIHGLTPGQRVEAIQEMFPAEREIFLKAESTLDALKGMSFFKRNKYLYGGYLINPQSNYNSLKSLMKMGVAILVGASFILGLVYMFDSSGLLPNGDSGITFSSPSISERSAWTYTTLILEKRLKNPKSADFGGKNVSYLGDSRYSVSGYVDATNSFGATIRTDFSCIIKDLDGSWRIEQSSGL